jgi:hypothetical protein
VVDLMDIAIEIERAMRDIFDCQSGSIEKAALKWLERDDVDVVEFVGRFRSVLALAALRLKKVKPDLVVLDEFHRYADLIVPKAETSNVRLKQERARIHRLLVEALLGGDERPAVLLLSATPYRLRRLGGDAYQFALRLPAGPRARLPSGEALKVAAVGEQSPSSRGSLAVEPFHSRQ